MTSLPINLHSYSVSQTFTLFDARWGLVFSLIKWILAQRVDDICQICDEIMMGASCTQFCTSS